MCWCTPENVLPYCGAPYCKAPKPVNGHNHNAPAVDDTKQGDCDLCGEWSGDLRTGACAGCVAFYRLA